MREWLREELTSVVESLTAAYLFGSALRLDKAPRDVDVILVSVDNAGEPEWRRLREWRDEVVARFIERFGIPLSAMVVTPAEWREIDGAIVREREALI